MELLELKRSNELFCTQLDACYNQGKVFQARIASLEEEVKVLKVKEVQLDECLRNMDRMVEQSEAMECRYDELSKKLMLAQEDVNRMEQKMLQENIQGKQLSSAFQEIYVFQLFILCSLLCLGKAQT